MGVALGWMALALAAVAGCTGCGAGRRADQVHGPFHGGRGVGWREAVFTRLTPGDPPGVRDRLDGTP